MVIPNKEIPNRFPSICTLHPPAQLLVDRALNLEWGEADQIASENDLFQTFVDLKVFTSGYAEECCLKATTEEMVEWIEGECKKFIDTYGLPENQMDVPAETPFLLL